MPIVDILRPKTYRAHYPRWMVGDLLLLTSSYVCGIGDAMFGYSQGCISTALVQPSFIRTMYGVQGLSLEVIAKGETGVNEYLIGITVACLNITAFFAAFFAASVCDTLGRRASIRIGAFFCLISAIMQAYAPNLSVFITGRCIQGIGVGFLSMTVPIFQAEVAPGDSRGMFITFENMFLNGGYSASTWVGYMLYHAETSWRDLYVILIFSSLFLLLFSILILPETPRWLIKNGFYAEGLATLADLQAGGNAADEGIKETYKEIFAAIENEKQVGSGDAGWREIFTKYTRRTVMAITSQMFAQLNGINAILYYLPENLLRAGFDVSQALLYTGVSSTMLLIGIIPTSFLADLWGRRPILILGGAGMILCLSAVGGLQYYVDRLSGASPQLASAANGIFACVCLYLAFFAFSWGPIPWLIPAEVFPLRARAKGMALATGSNWLWNFIVAFATPPLFAALRGGTYFIIALFVIISVLLVIFFYRETAHRTLEELSEVFGDSLVNVGKVVVPDERRTSAAMVAMHSHTFGSRLGSGMGRRSRGTSMSMSAMGGTSGTGTSMGMLGSVMESGVDATPVHKSSSQQPDGYQRKTQSQRGLAIDDTVKEGASATKSQATLAGSGSSMGIMCEADWT